MIMIGIGAAVDPTVFTVWLNANVSSTIREGSAPFPQSRRLANLVANTLSAIETNIYDRLRSWDVMFLAQFEL